MVWIVRGGNVGDPDLPTREQVQEWLDAQPTCIDGVIGCVRKHKVAGTREHIVEDICYNPDLTHQGCY